MKSRCARGRARLAVLLGHLRGSDSTTCGEPDAVPGRRIIRAPTTRTGRCGMSPETHDLTWSELDRLADYTADALPPTDAASVARLVATDPRWSAAHRALHQADVAVRADLATAAALPTRDARRCGGADRCRASSAHTGRLSPSTRREHKRRRAFTAGIAAAAATVVAVHGRDRVEHRPDPVRDRQSGDGGGWVCGPRRTKRARAGGISAGRS